ncbi:uncharacterized protein LOC120331014 isoform X2 [Styela clava]
MFYTHDLLVGPSGRFSLIWRAAMKKEKIKKKKLDALDVYETCKDLIKYIKPSADPRMGHIKGFSLRLSAQLVHGVIVCFNLKVAYFLNEVRSSWKSAATKRYLMHELCTELAESKRGQISKQKEQNFQLDINFDEDPMFGKIFSDNFEDFPAIKPPHTTTEESTSSSSSEGDKKRRKIDRHVVADISQITLPEGVSTTMETRGDDLLIQGEVGQFHVDDLHEFANIPSMFDGPSISKEPSWTVQQNVTTPSGAMLPGTPIMPPQIRRSSRRQTDVDESILAVPIQDITVVGQEQEEFQLPPPEAGASAQNLSEVQPPSLVLDPIDEGFLLSKKRKKRKLIIDKRIGLTGAEIRQQFRTKLNTIEDDYVREQLAEPLYIVPASVLFSTPVLQCSGIDHQRPVQERDSTTSIEPDIQDLFNESIQAIRRDIHLPQDPEIEADISAARSKDSMLDESSMAPVRDASRLSELEPVPELDPSFEGPATRRGSTRNKSMLDIPEDGTSKDHSSLREDIFDMDLLPPVPEQPSSIDMPDVVTEPSFQEPLQLIDDDMQLGMDQFQEASVLEKVKALWEEYDHVTFSMLAPARSTSRSEAARRFYGLLACAKARSVVIKQKEIYGEIKIEQRPLVV